MLGAIEFVTDRKLLFQAEVTDLYSPCQLWASSGRRCQLDGRNRGCPDTHRVIVSDILVMHPNS